MVEPSGDRHSSACARARCAIPGAQLGRAAPTGPCRARVVSSRITLPGRRRRLLSRAETVVALAPAGGWARGDSYDDLLRSQRTLHDLAKVAAPHAETMLATPQGRRRATQLIPTSFSASRAAGQPNR